jgi:hypothetical protein
MDQTLAKKTLQALIKREDLKNKVCIDCSNPSPQWASLRSVVIYIWRSRSFPHSFGSFGPNLLHIATHEGTNFDIPQPFFFVFNALERIEGSVFISGAHASCHRFHYIPTVLYSFVRSVSMDTWHEDQVKRMTVRDKHSLSYPLCELLSTARRECTLPNIYGILHPCRARRIQTRVDPLREIPLLGSYSV